MTSSTPSAAPSALPTTPPPPTRTLDWLRLSSSCIVRHRPRQVTLDGRDAGLVRQQHRPLWPTYRQRRRLCRHPRRTWRPWAARRTRPDSPYRMPHIRRLRKKPSILPDLDSRLAAQATASTPRPGCPRHLSCHFRCLTPLGGLLMLSYKPLQYEAGTNFGWPHPATHLAGNKGERGHGPARRNRGSLQRCVRPVGSRRRTKNEIQTRRA